MAARPSEYYLSLYDFFALLLPGALFTYWLLPVLHFFLNDLPFTTDLQSGTGGWIAFLLTAFFVGQVLFSFAATLDWIGDKFADRRVLDNERKVQQHLSDIPEGKLRHVGSAWLRVNCPNAMPDLERFTALSKFYRSLSVVFFLIMVVGYFDYDPSTKLLHWSWSWQIGWWWVLPMLSLVIVSFIAYVHYRIRHRQAVVLYLRIAR